MSNYDRKPFRRTAYTIASTEMLHILLQTSERAEVRMNAFSELKKRGMKVNT